MVAVLIARVIAVQCADEELTVMAELIFLFVGASIANPSALAELSCCCPLHPCIEVDEASTHVSSRQRYPPRGHHSSRWT